MPRRRFVYEFDTRPEPTPAAHGSTETDTDANVIGDAFMIDRKRLLLIERDDFEGAGVGHQAALPRSTCATPTTTASSTKQLVVDLLRIANPDHIGDDRLAGALRCSATRSPFPLQSVESVVRCGDGRILVGNDNNYPGNDGRSRRARPTTPR